jgi:hypothetical protein
MPSTGLLPREFFAGDISARAIVTSKLQRRASMTDKEREDIETNDTGSAARTPGGLPPEKVEDRPDVSQVTPEDYPSDQRAK